MTHSTCPAVLRCCRQCTRLPSSICAHSNSTDDNRTRTENIILDSSRTKYNGIPRVHNTRTYARRNSLTTLSGSVVLISPVAFKAAMSAYLCFQQKPHHRYKNGNNVYSLHNTTHNSIQVYHFKTGHLHLRAGLSVALPGNFRHVHWCKRIGWELDGVLRVEVEVRFWENKGKMGLVESNRHEEILAMLDVAGITKNNTAGARS